MSFDKWFEQNYSHIQDASLKLAIREATNKAYDFGWNASCDNISSLTTNIFNIIERTK